VALTPFKTPLFFLETALLEPSESCAWEGLRGGEVKDDWETFVWAEICHQPVFPCAAVYTT
jgi:hypothetical protein